MTLPDSTPRSVFPGAANPVASAQRVAGAFATPAMVEFPMVTDPENDAMSAFGSRVQADHDANLLDARVCHVRDVRYGPGSQPAKVSPVAPEAPRAGRMRTRGPRRMVVALLVGAAVGLLVAAAVAAFFLLT